jgi:hypothetical protein
MEHGHGVKGLETIVCMITKLEWVTQSKSFRPRHSGTLRDAKNDTYRICEAQWKVCERSTVVCDAKDIPLICEA